MKYIIKYYNLFSLDIFEVHSINLSLSSKLIELELSFNTSLISSVNRKNSGIVDEPTAIERIVRGMDITPLVEERDKRKYNTPLKDPSTEK